MRVQILVERSQRHRRWGGVGLFAGLAAAVLSWEQIDQARQPPAVPHVSAAAQWQAPLLATAAGPGLGFGEPAAAPFSGLLESPEPAASPDTSPAQR